MAQPLEKAPRPHKPHPKKKFTQTEDRMLQELVRYFGDKNWKVVAEHMNGRNPRQCRDRWLNYLSPSVMNGPWTCQEDLMLDNLYNHFGAKWVKITKFFPRRTDINVKNRWLVLQRKKKKIDTSITISSPVPIELSFIDLPRPEISFDDAEPLCLFNEITVDPFQNQPFVTDW